MRIAKVRIQNFRGFTQAEFNFLGHTVIAGEPRAGRSDFVRALKRVLDPRSTRARVNPLDIYRPIEGESPLTEVEVTLLELGTDLELLLSDYLEAFDPISGNVVDQAGAASAVLGVRLCYRAKYDHESDSGEHWVDAAGSSDVDTSTFKRVSRFDRESFPVLFVDTSMPLQIRAEGSFRVLLETGDADGLDVALEALDTSVSEATQVFSQSTPVAAALEGVLEAGAGNLLGADSVEDVGFATDDGSLAGLLRALQPALDLDAAGMLPLTSHGSSVQAVLSASEAVAAAGLNSGELVIIADDFGDSLDAASAEYLAMQLRKAASQFLVTTRRPEVVRAFKNEEILRFTRSHGRRLHHRLSPTDKASRVVRRLALDQLLSAVTSRTVVLLEGPLDAEGYGALASRLAVDTGKKEYSLPANGVRLVSPPGSDGGMSRLPALAKLAGELGFHVRAVIDTDKPGTSDDVITTLLGLVEQLVVLPPRTAVEAALVRGIQGSSLRDTVETLAGLGMPPLPDEIEDEGVAEYLINSKTLKKQGLHVAWVYALEKQPPLARRVIAAVCGESLGRVNIEDISL